MGVGILSAIQVSDELMPEGRHQSIRRPSGNEISFNASSIDLPLGDKYWLMQGSCRSGPDLTVTDLIAHHAVSEHPQTLTSGTVLDKGQVYLIKLDCEVGLQDSRVCGKSTGRSSIGRLDVLVRMLTANAVEFDLLPEDAAGDLYVEVAPISFSLIVSPGICLSQLRLYRGREDLFTLTMEELGYEYPFPVVDATGKPIHPDEGTLRNTVYPFSLDLTPDPETRFCGFAAKKEQPAPIDPEKKAHYEPAEFWEPVEMQGNSLLLEPDRLYILRSKQRLKKRGQIAVECQAYTESLGEWRIEYAGFAHPFFGFSRENGTPIIFEVRGHNIPTILRDGLRLGNVSFRRMSRPAEAPPPEAQQYEKQELKLSSCFKPWNLSSSAV